MREGISDQWWPGGILDVVVDARIITAVLDIVRVMVRRSRGGPLVIRQDNDIPLLGRGWPLRTGIARLGGG
jgi:hypothetical protein